jgi:hypothetical protein
MILKKIEATTGILGFDTNTKLTEDLSKKLYNYGFRFCLRYLSRSPEPNYDLTADEANQIMDGGLSLMGVQHVRAGYWIPTADLGTQDGTMAAKNATLAGLPIGINIWCDLEAVKDTTPATDVITYCTNWYNAVNQAGYVPGLYVGYQPILVSAQLYQLPFTSFWRSQSNVPNVGSRGYQMIQLYAEIELFGIKLDVDITQSDFKNSQVTWVTKIESVNP